jgi:hypothetical protein
VFVVDVVVGVAEGGGVGFEDGGGAGLGEVTGAKAAAFGHVDDTLEALRHLAKRAKSHQKDTRTEDTKKEFNA